MFALLFALKEFISTEKRQKKIAFQIAKKKILTYFKAKNCKIIYYSEFLGVASFRNV